MTAEEPQGVAEDAGQTEPKSAAKILTRLERMNVRLARTFSKGIPKHFSYFYLHGLVAPFIYFTVWRRLHIFGFENLPSDRNQRILLVSNHRSFFDQYILITVLFLRGRIRHNFYFPVRSDFFYDSVIGGVLNAIIGGFTMYPPFFRQPAKRAFNRWGLEEAVALLNTPGVLVGMHPEGTRNKGPDPYALLPAQPGAGELCYKSRPAVLPVFVLGVTDAFVKEVASNFLGNGPPIIIVIGKPIEFDDYYAQGGRLSVYKRMSERMLERIVELGAVERGIRTRLENEGARAISS